MYRPESQVVDTTKEALMMAFTHLPTTTPAILLHERPHEGPSGQHQRTNLAHLEMDQVLRVEPSFASYLLNTLLEVSALSMKQKRKSVGFLKVLPKVLRLILKFV